MTLLTSPLDADSLALVKVVAAGFRVSGGEWPVWQYVDLMLAEQGVDGETAYTGLPSWEHRYRSVWSNGSGFVPRPDEFVALTVHGLHHSGHPLMADLANAFISVLRFAASQRLSLEPDPKQALSVKLNGADLTVKANMGAGTSFSIAQIGSLLQREPATWSGIDVTNDEWTWDVERHEAL